VPTPTPSLVGNFTASALDSLRVLLHVCGAPTLKGERLLKKIPPILAVGLLGIVPSLISRQPVYPQAQSATPAPPQAAASKPVQLPNDHLLAPLPGDPLALNTLPAAMATSPDHGFVAILNGGYGAYTSNLQQSIAIYDCTTGSLTDFPDSRLGQRAHQTYFLGLGFSSDGTKLYASIGSMTDPLGTRTRDTGNGLAVYSFSGGSISPAGFIKVPPRSTPSSGKLIRRNLLNVTFPAGFSIFRSGGRDLILLASNLSDEAILLDPATGTILHRFDLSLFKRLPASLPRAAAVTPDGKIGFVSLWNASRVAEIDLAGARILRMIPLKLPASPIAPGSHPTSMVFSPDAKYLFVALSNSDAVAEVRVSNGAVIRYLSSRLPGQKYAGSGPQGLALNEGGSRLYVADSIADAVAVFHLDSPSALPAGFVPAGWFPMSLAVDGGTLLVAAGKGSGTIPNDRPLSPVASARREREYPYVAALLRGSLARIPLSEIESKLPEFTAQVLAENRLSGNSDSVEFARGRNPIRHVIYIIKENRTYDQLFGDLGAGNGDPSLTMYGKSITPNQHALALQFGVLDNFYDSGDVSANGHVWSTSATTTDYLEDIWPIGYRGHERTYDSEGSLLDSFPLLDQTPDASEPETGYLWGNLARHGLSYRHYGEFISTKWCNARSSTGSPKKGTPHPEGAACSKSVILPGEPLPANVGQPHGSPSPYGWPIPLIASNVATKPELVDHFDPLFPDFEVSYPDQLRVDEFLNEFSGFVASRADGKNALPSFIMLRLPNDHTGGGRIGRATPSALVADNDLAVGRVVEAVSHSPYWDDTAIFILEDDAQDGPDHVDCHRSIALVVSKYAPRNAGAAEMLPTIQHNFYTTISVVRTIEALLGLPPMNQNDASASLMSPLFTGAGDQPPFNADASNRTNGLLYEINKVNDAATAKMDFTHADAADPSVLNKFLWHDRMGDRPMPPPRHTVFVSAP
jgi:DNA-binding beta-propeller fold protein YncE